MNLTSSINIYVLWYLRYFWLQAVIKIFWESLSRLVSLAPFFLLVLSYPADHCQVLLTNSLLLPFHLPARKPSIFKNLGSISIPQQSTEGTDNVAPVRLPTRINEASPQNWPRDYLPQILLLHCLYTSVSRHSSHSSLKQYALGRSRFSYNPILYLKSFLAMPHWYLAIHIIPCKPLALPLHWLKTDPFL